MDRCVYGSIAQRSFHKRLSTEGNVYLVKDRKEQAEANCAMIHHRPTYDIAQCDLIQTQPVSPSWGLAASPEGEHPAYQLWLSGFDRG